MNQFDFVSAFIVGLAGGVHCVGMCGGIVGALSYAIPKNASPFPYTIMYNLGRILSYSLAGGLSGYLGVVFANQVTQGLVVLQFISAVFLMLLAAYISGVWAALTKVETLGRHIWAYLQPISRRFIPFTSPLSALPYGMIWGWLPCGLVYSVLTWSLASGSFTNGALLMIGFGMGTLPIMILMSLGFTSIQQTIQRPIVRHLMGITLFLFACTQLWAVVQNAVKT
jgi:sulfite exporter TauE/SafE